MSRFLFIYEAVKAIYNFNTNNYELIIWISHHKGKNTKNRLKELDISVFAPLFAKELLFP